MTVQVRGAKKAQTEILFKEITAEGYVNKTDAVGPRAEFIKRAIKEVGMTPHGAATYWQGFKNVERGGKMYYTAKKKDKNEQTFVEVVPEVEEAPSNGPNPSKKLRRAKKETATA